MQGNQISLYFGCILLVEKDYLFLWKDDEDIKLSSLNKNKEKENLM